MEILEKNIHTDLSKLKSQVETLQLLHEGIKAMKIKWQKEIKEEKERIKEQQLEQLKQNIGVEMAEKFVRKMLEEEEISKW